MEQQQAQQVEQYLRQNWQEIRHQILDQFVQVSTADLEAASSVNDLVRRIADRSHYTEPYVEARLRELVGVAAGVGQSAQAEGGAEQATAEDQRSTEAVGEEQAEPLGGSRQAFGGSEQPADPG
ncbi:hypothetical protein [Frankia sp. Cas3]|uniref:hypothetical protein n=1 Tax=Frankia sp. Cas3 TaxID=3073926 RepID=UPI002AD57348|nr:hypothetical protein [Frankia sp. Cas3]